MSLKENPNMSEKNDKEQTNGDSINDVETKKKSTKLEANEESLPVMKTRSSKRSSANKIAEDNDSKSNNETPAIDQKSEEKEEEEAVNKSEEVKPLENESNTDVLNGSISSDDKKSDDTNTSQENEEQTDDTHESEDKEKSNSKEEFILDSETIMEPLVLQPDEACPELEFEESSDRESEKHSPVLSRCTTRRSQNRYIPTPNTPRTIYEPEPEKDLTDSEKGAGTPLPEAECSSKNIHLNETRNSSANVSMTVQVGGNDTRTDFSEGESELLQSLRSKGSKSTSQYLSSRRSLRSFRSDVHSKSLRDSLYKNKSQTPYALSRDSMERAPSVKRKDRSETPEDRKKMKTDGSGFFVKLSSPLTNLRNKFSTPTGTSTPKLTLYKDEKNCIDGDFIDQVEMPQEAGAAHSKWCEIM